MAAELDFLPVYNFGPCIISTSEIDTALAQLQPLTGKGLLIYSDTAPDILNNSRYSTFVWVDTSNPTPVQRWYDSITTSWLPFTYTDINGDNLQDYSVSLVKLDPETGNADRVLRVNSAGTQVIFDTPGNLFSSNSFPIAKLVKGANNTVLITDGTGTITWATYATITAALSGITLSQISTSGAVDYSLVGYLTAGGLAYRPVLDYFADKTFPIGKLLPAIGQAGKSLVVDPTGLFITYQNTSASSAVYTFPAAGGVLTTHPHGLAAIPGPNQYSVVALNIASDPLNLDWDVGDEVNITSMQTGTFSGDDAIMQAFTIWADATNIYAVRNNYEDIILPAKDGTVTSPVPGITSTSWQLKFRVTSA